MINLIIAGLVGVLILAAMDFYQNGKVYVKSNWMKYAFDAIVISAIGFFIEKPMMQYFLLALGGIAIGRITIGLKKIATPDAGDVLQKSDQMVLGRTLIRPPSEWNAKNWFHFTVVFGMLAFISYCQNYSYWADNHNFNGIFGWVGVGIVFTLIALFGAYKVTQNSNRGQKNSSGQ